MHKFSVADFDLKRKCGISTKFSDSVSVLFRKIFKMLGICGWNLWDQNLYDEVTKKGVKSRQYPYGQGNLFTVFPGIVFCHKNALAF